jgi:uncharacterized protein (DUF4415 family)
MTKKTSARDNDAILDLDNPPWTRDRIARAVPFGGLPEDVQRALRGRGPQKAPRKVPISIRLSPEVAEGLRATGEGWQVRADDALREWLARRKETAR